MKKIAHITDLHLDEQFPIDHGVDGLDNLQQLLLDIEKRGIEEVIFTGDIGTPNVNELFFETFRKANLNLRITLGNHDTFSHTVNYYNPNLPETRLEMYYVSQDEYFKYIFLDTSTEKVSETQLQWFKDELNTTKKILLFMHHPVLETGTIAQKEFPLEGDAKLLELLKMVTQEVYIFCGHIHLEDYQTEGNISQFVTPAACFQTKRNSSTTALDNIDFGYRLLSINGDQLSSEVIMFSKDG